VAGDSPSRAGGWGAIAEPQADEVPYQVSAIERVTPTIVEAWLRPLGKPMAFQSGQYALLEDAERRVPPRSYSLANAPRADGALSLLVTRVAEGNTSGWIHDLRGEEEVIVTGPYGNFVGQQTSTAPCLFLAAGSGLAPIRALIETSLKTTPRRSVTVVFSARTNADLLSRDLFLAWQAVHQRFRFIVTLTGEGQRRRVPDLLPDICPDLTHHEVFIAGSPGFVHASAAAAEALGAARTRVYSEPFFVAPRS
jgi:CDP-4-dehydro-6-deoxyglucose reductase, E3